MDYQLREGVALHVIPTKQFKTTQVVINLTAPHERATVTQRSLLANLVELGSMRYPDQNIVARKLAEMYGASFGTDLHKYGTVHSFRFIISIPNEKFLTSTDDLMDTALDFVKTMIFEPLVTDTGFDQAIFDRQKANMAADFASIIDDKQSYAAQKLADLYFGDDQAIPSYGQAADLDEITPASLLAYYQEMLAQDQVDMFVLGDVEPDAVVTKLSALPFEARPKLTTNVNYQQASKPTVLRETDHFDVSQAKLNLAYQFPVDIKTDERFAATVFNALFGASPLSKLFVNVREKASLAYYASSQLSTTTQSLTVQTGIEGQNLELVLAIIDEQIKAIQTGDFTDEDLKNVIANLVNSYESSLDSPRMMIERAAVQSITGRQTSVNSWLDKIEAVTKAEVMAVAQHLNLQAIYFLTGDDNGKD
ncbi:insulinase family protein [Periweissella cryptocerci]|uniref:Insulinase family protein n=1 Tax=Periweissella cryptocerci TaxID=2506420 RepID=A0A4P6YSC3_9LACO|nr:pitrilysin family protein [Periweissella cryptocerci]QBO35594.1 insulinase family protein [Periweissella cryptocerci]